MTKQTFQFEFCELPLVIEGGFEAGLVDGSAEIAYTSDVWDFSIRSISLDGHKRRLEWTAEEHRIAELKGLPLKKWDEKPVVLDVGHPLYSIIYSRLEHEWAHKVQDDIRNEIEENRNFVASYLADHRRDELQGI